MRDTASSCRATAAAACSRRSTRPAAPPRSTTTGARVDEAKTLDAPCLVLVVGGLPGALAGAPRTRTSPRRAREVRDGIAATLEYARERRHAARDRAAASDVRGRPRLRQHARAGARPLRCARPASAQRRARASRVDVYHVWWDPKLEAQIARAGRERLLAFHVCDWLVPTRDLLNDRGMMGDGVIEIPQHPRLGRGRGFAGYSEVEIFSTRDWWKRPADEVLATCIERHRSAV